MRIVRKDTVDYEEMLHLAHEIIAGVYYLVPKTGALKGILQSWQEHDGEGAPGDDPNSYRTGVAACMRYLLYAYQQNESLSPDFKTGEYQTFIRTNADYVKTNPSKRGDLRAFANDLATLVAALVILE